MSDILVVVKLTDIDKELMPNIIINTPTNLFDTQTSNSVVCPAPPSSPISGPVNCIGPLLDHISNLAACYSDKY